MSRPGAWLNWSSSSSSQSKRHRPTLENSGKRSETHRPALSVLLENELRSKKFWRALNETRSAAPPGTPAGTPGPIDVFATPVCSRTVRAGWALPPCAEKSRLAFAAKLRRQCVQWIRRIVLDDGSTGRRRPPKTGSPTTMIPRTRGAVSQKMASVSWVA